MARTPAMNTRLDFAYPVKPDDMATVLDYAEKIQELKDHAASLGFVQSKEAKSMLGSFDFAEAPETEAIPPVDPDASEALAADAETETE